MQKFDLTIIGGGPVGLFSAFYACRRGMKTAIIEALPEVGGQPLNLYPEKEILDIPGIQNISGLDLSKSLFEQAQSINLTILTETKAQSYTGDLKEGFVLKCNTPGGDIEIISRAIVITTGVGEIKPREIDAPGEKEFDNKGVYYYLKDSAIVNNKRVVVVGGGDSALDWVNHISSRVKTIDLVHRSDAFRAQEESLRALELKNIYLHLNSRITKIHGTDFVTGVDIINNADETMHIKCDLVLAALGFHINLGSMSNWPLQTEKGSIVVKVNMETSVPGIFAAGDVTYTPGLGNSKLFVIGFSQATIAVNTAKTLIDTKASFFPGHSTSWKE